MGKLADLVILEHDPRSVDRGTLKDLKVVEAMQAVGLGLHARRAREAASRAR